MPEGGTTGAAVLERGGAAAVAGGAPAALRLSVFGPMRAEAGAAAVRLRSRKARAVLGYLALSDKGEETRERLVGLLWSESEEEKARASLRQVVHELREALDAAGLGHGLRAERLCVALDPRLLSHDLGEVLREAEAGRAHALLLDTPRLPETLLEGLDDVDPAFRVWLLARRQAVHDRLMRLLEPGLRGTGAADRRARRALAQAVLRLDPTHEEACRALMAAAAAEGDTAAALRAYEALWTLLGDEYDMEPSAATQELVAAIKSGRFEAEVGVAAAEVAPVVPPPVREAGAPVAALPAAAAAPARIALLVEPFGVNGVPADRAHLVDGFRHDLVACLVRFREWFVVDGPVLPAEALNGARVSGRYRISGTAYQAGGRVSMVLTLAEQDSGIFVWSERLDLTLEGWFEAQQRVMRRISGALNLHISNAQLARNSAEPDISLEAHDRWLRTQVMILGFDAPGWERAVALLEATTAQTPNFAPAWSSLAQLDNGVHIFRPGVRRERAREARSLRNARRAVELDPTDSRAQLCLGWSLTMAGRHEQAEVPMRLALDLNPYDSWTLTSAALFRSFCGQHADATELSARAMEMTLVPTRTQWGYQVTIAYLAGDDVGALEACDASQDIIRTLQAWRAAALANLGHRAEAAEAAARYLETIRAAWYGGTPPSDAEMVRWLLHLYPIRHARDWARLRDGLAAAGLPVGGAAHGDWYADPPRAA